MRESYGSSSNICSRYSIGSCSECGYFGIAARRRQLLLLLSSSCLSVVRAAKLQQRRLSLEREALLFPAFEVSMSLRHNTSCMLQA